MKKIIKGISLLIAVMMVISTIGYTDVKVVKADNSSQWKNDAIVSPAQGKLIGAGYIDVKWNNNLDGVKSYKVFIDGSLKKTVNASTAATMSAEFYTTKVSAHTACIIATLTNGTTVTTSTRTFYVTKKGLCVDTNMGRGVNASALNIGWYYNWGTKSFEEDNFANKSFYGMDYVPMVWGSGTDRYAAFANAKKQGYKYILGYNEPDLTGNQSSHMEVDVVLYKWASFMQSGLRVGSPSLATFPNWSTKWWDPFWNSVKSTTRNGMDFIAVHSYQGSLNGTKTALQYLQAVDECYETYHKPIWITEFAVAGNKWFNPKNASDVANVQAFMKVVLKGLNERSYVERFSWFNFNPTEEKAGASGIFNYNTGALTTLGKIYAQIGNPAGYKAVSYGVNSSSTVNTSAVACALSMNTNIYTVKAKKKSFKYELKAVSKAAGYQIQYSLNKKFKKAKKYKTKTKNVTKIKGTIKGLKKKKTYYVRARAYKVLNGQRLYCKWSPREKVKIKK